MTELGILGLPQPTINSAENKVFALPVNEKRVMSLRATGQLIRVHSGNAWITCNGEDILLESGQETQLPRNRCHAMISPVGSPTVIFEIIRHIS